MGRQIRRSRGTRRTDEDTRKVEQPHIQTKIPYTCYVESFKQTLEKAAETEAQRRYRFLIVNEHYLGHVSVHRLFCRALETDPQVEFDPETDTIRLDTVENLLERLQRRFASLRFGTAWMQQQNLDFARWRFQRFVALLARKRIDRALARAKKAGRPYDAIAIHSQTAAFAATDLMKQMPCLISTDISQTQASLEWNSPATRWTYQPGIRLEKLVFERASAIAVFSDWCRNAILVENPALPPAKVRTLPPGVELGPFVELPLERPPAEKLRLLFVGGDFARKGGPDLVACWEEYLKETFELHIVSNGAPAGLEEKGIAVYRDLKPYSQELLERYREADVFVLPTLNEAYGHVFIEAMAAGLPVVATRINAIPEIVPPEGLPLLIPPGNREALREAILSLQDPARRQALGQTVRDKAKARFDAGACFAAYVGWLKAISG